MKLKVAKRQNTNCYKWDSIAERYQRDDLLPFWVADMDFCCCNEILEAIDAYTRQGAFGYTYPFKAYFDSFIEWERKYHDVVVERQWIRYSPSVVTGIAWILENLVRKGDAGMVLTPMYAPLYKLIERSGMELVCCELENNGGYYSINFELFEELVKSRKVKVFLLCSPHNPVGRVWSREELKRMLEICRRHSVYVISDEVHQDYVYTEHEHMSVLRFTEHLDHVALVTSVAKSFNLAGLANSFVVIPQERLRAAYDSVQDRLCFHEGNAYGYIAASTAYRVGRPWLEEVSRTVYDNYLFAAKFLQDALPKVTISPLEGTFLMWIDLGKYILPSETIQKKMIDDWGIVVNPGSEFGGDRYRSYIRFNLATSKERVKKGLTAIVNDLRGKECGL